MNVPKTRRYRGHIYTLQGTGYCASEADKTVNYLRTHERGLAHKVLTKDNGYAVYFHRK